jgi:HSP20 family protein
MEELYAESAATKEHDTAGTNAHTTSGKNQYTKSKPATAPRKAKYKSLKLLLIWRVFMAEKKKSSELEAAKKNEVAVASKKAPASRNPRKKPTAMAPAAQADLWDAFDDVFGRFRSDFEDLLFPSYWDTTLSLIPETRVPAVDLEDREKDYLLKAEMPGFKKEDIEIEVQDDSIVITGNVGWKYDKKAQDYICKERACQSFYREVELPEKIKADEVSANLSDGVLEITLPKKALKQKKKVIIK